MSDRYVEKSFLYLLALSVLFHVAVYQLIALIPPGSGSVKSAPEPTIVDLTDLPEPVKPKAEITKRPEKKQRLTREMPQKQRSAGSTIQQLPRTAAPAPLPPTHPQAPTPSIRKAEPLPMPRGNGKQEPVTHGEGIFKPKAAEGIDRAKLFPSANRMARLEDSYRERYSREIEDGETKFLNTDDIQFGSFLRRLETAVYGVWRYPQAALVRGIEGTTPVRITFDRSGEIVRVELLETSGSVILDDEVMRTLKQLGPIGSFPKGYSGQTFKLIAFFNYGNGGGRMH
jgi:periplasmic protein TonB